MKKLIFALFLMFTPCAFASQTFNDVPPSSPYYAAVEKCYAANIMLGFGDGTFRPNEALPRWQAAIVITRALGYSDKEPCNANYFDDVEQDEYFYCAINKFAELGITSGCGARLFCPYNVTTREQLAAFIVKSLGEFSPPVPVSQRFSDVPPSNPFYNFIDRLAVLGITQGCTSTTFCPGDAVTRGTMAVFVVRAYGL